MRRPTLWAQGTRRVSRFWADGVSSEGVVSGATKYEKLSQLYVGKTCSTRYRGFHGARRGRATKFRKDGLAHRSVGSTRRGRTSGGSRGPALRGVCRNTRYLTAVARSSVWIHGRNEFSVDMIDRENGLVPAPPQAGRGQVSAMKAPLPGAAPGATGASAWTRASPVGPATVDVVVVAYNSRDTLRVCVEPMARVPWVDVTLVDNMCPENSFRVAEDLSVRIVRSPRNGGFAYGCNLGMAYGSADFVLLLNPDAEIDAASLAELVDALRADPSLGGVGPRTVDDAGNVIFTQRRFPRLRFTYAQGLFLHRAAPGAAWGDDAIRDPNAYERPGTPEWISGCCVLLRRDAVASVGGLDEGFFLYSEETDLFKRLATAGWRAGFEPRATARHIGYQSADRNTTAPIRAVSRVRYARKHHGRLVAALEASGVALGSLVRAAVWIRYTARARGNLLAARAALRSVRSKGASTYRH